MIALVSDDGGVLSEHLCRGRAIPGSIRAERFSVRWGALPTCRRRLCLAPRCMRVRRRAERAGYSAAAVTRLGAHNLRAGFVTQAFRNGADAHADHAPDTTPEPSNG